MKHRLFDALVHYYLYKLNSAHKQPKVIFTDDPEDDCAGRSWKSSDTIEINLAYLSLKNRDEVMYQILPHELAHLLAPEEADDHGPEWQALMRRMGARAEAEHELSI